jgi:hypothetical protein
MRQIYCLGSIVYVLMLCVATPSHAQEPTPILPSAIPVTPERPAEEPLPEPSLAPTVTSATATTAPAANTMPDHCEPNNERQRACTVIVDQVNGPYTFLPGGDQDWYRFELPAAGLATLITVRGTAGLDLLTTISRDDGTTLGSFNSPAISTTLGVEITGGIVVRVEKRDPEAAQGQSYVIEVRRSLPPAPAPTADPIALLVPDLLENNWNTATAAPIAVGVVYELNFVCPVSWGCPGGDHDYLRLPVKGGLRYLIATFDLGPGSDTILDLFWNDESQYLTSNDDVRPGASFLSVLRWVAPADGHALIRIGPRTGGLAPRIPDSDGSSYRFAVALAESDLATQIEERIAEQTNAPRSTATVAPAPARPAPAAPAPAAAPVPPTALPVSSDAPKGMAVVRVETTALREGPGERTPLIQALPAESSVTLLGQASGAWVRVQPIDVAPVAAAAATTTTTIGPTNAAATPLPAATAVARQPANLPQPLNVERLDPLPPPPPAPPTRRLPLSVSVSVRAVPPALLSDEGTRSTAVPTAGRPLAGQRVQLINAFGDLLAEAVTPSDGQLTLTTEVAPGTAVLLQLPVPGLRVAVDPTRPDVLITIAEETDDDLTP